MKQIIFCGCGGMYNYSFGVAKIIQDIKKDYPDVDINYFGISGGCFPALYMALNIDINTFFYTFNKDFLGKINGTILGSFFNWYKFAKKYTLKSLPKDSFKLNNLTFSITEMISPFTKNNIVINKWENNEDLIDSMIASSFIPIFGGHLYKKFRNKYCIDGCLTYDYKDRKDTKDILYIYPDKWCEIKTNWYYCYSDFGWGDKLYKNGIADAQKHKQEIIDFFEK